MKRLSRSFLRNSFFAAALLMTPALAHGGVFSREYVATHDTGVGLDGFEESPWTWIFDLSVGYDDNIYTTHTNEVGSFFSSFSPAVSGEFGTPRTQITIGLGGGIAYYWDRPGRDYDLNARLTLGVAHSVSERLQLGFNTTLMYAVEPDFGSAAIANRRSGNYFYVAALLSAAYNWTPTFQTITSYNLTGIIYDDSAIGFVEDRLEHTFGNQFRFLVSPRTAAVGEYRFLVVDYFDSPRDSVGHFFLAGVDHTFNPRADASFRAGVEHRDYDNAGSVTSPYAEGTLNYAYGPFSSLQWIDRYGIEQADVAGSRNRTTFRTGLSITHGLTSQFALFGSVFYTHSEYEGGFVDSFSENALDLSVGARYSLNRNFSVQAGYNFSTVDSGVFFRDYTRNRVFAGVRLSF